MRTIIVDDEPLALHHMSDELERIEVLEIIGKYRDPFLAWEQICLERPDAVFLDIEMPGMRGTALAELIIQEFPDMLIVFVTVYEEYAIEAFELNAMDYVLKPIRRERIAKTVERLLKAKQEHALISIPAHKTRMLCFGTLKFERGGHKPYSLKWKTFKAQELFLFLFQQRGKAVRKELLLEELWPDIEPKKAMTQLYTAAYQIRKMIRDEGIDIQIINADEGYRLEIGEVELEVELWEEGLKAEGVITESNVNQHKKLFEAYIGGYLEEYGYIWSEWERQRLQRLWLEHSVKLGEYYLSSFKRKEAIVHYIRLQSILPTHESSYFELMRIYAQLSDRFSVERQYELLQSMLFKNMDCEPSSQVRQWYEEWKRHE